eukprot:TRINITY_DN6290_c0_g1_i2.p1 TRINITY_DN6290_c0_g1~~TRINITY_DN6290_c0_g1_i2.p1  ORF type:complete len:202 (-),score=39.54 TRINITY_DN6290_c0_g1_i2:57-662(-)
MLRLYLMYRDDGIIACWDIRTKGVHPSIVFEPNDDVEAWSMKGIDINQLIAGFGNGLLQIFDTRTSSALVSHTLETGICSLDTSPITRSILATTVISPEHEASICLIEQNSFNIIDTIKGAHMDTTIWSGRFVPQKNSFVSCSGNGDISKWNIDPTREEYAQNIYNNFYSNNPIISMEYETDQPSILYAQSTDKLFVIYDE